MRAEQPETLEALKNLLSLREPRRFIAGGTDLVIQLRKLQGNEHVIVDLNRIEAMRTISLTETGLFVGALSTMSVLEHSELVRTQCPCLSQAAARVGSTQIRNRATLGGNVVNGAQCADTVPALIALDASVRIMNSAGDFKRVKVSEFIETIGVTVLEPDEVVTGFEIPVSSCGLRGGSAKVGSRETVTIAKINCSVAMAITGNTVTFARAAFGSLGTKAFYSPSVSEALVGMSTEGLQEEKVLRFFEEQVAAAIPGRDSLSYKRSAVRAVATQVLAQCIGPAKR